MLKPDDPVFDELRKDIKKIVSGRYLEDPEAPFSGIYKQADRGEGGEEFGALGWRAREDVIRAFVPWEEYQKKGINMEQQSTVIENIADGKPRDHWLEGVFDEAVLESQKITGFNASVENLRNSLNNHVFEELGGNRLPWADLSAAAKLQYIALDAVRHDVPFERFAEVVKEMIGDVGEAALRVVLEGQKELHAIAQLVPEDGRTEPTPLVERVQELLDYALAVETREIELLQDREKLPEGMGGGKAADGILREGRHMPDEDLWQEGESLRQLHGHDTLAGLYEEIRADEAAAKREDAHGYGYGKAIGAQEGVMISGRHEDMLRDAPATAEADRSPAKTEEGKLSLQDLRNASKKQERQEGGQKEKPKEMER